MKHPRLPLDDQGRAGRSARSATPLSPASTIAVEPSRPGPVGELADALEILTRRMRVAVGERRTVARGSERYRRSDEMVAYLNSLYVRLQRRMEIPAEIWRLDGGSGRSRRHSRERRG